MKKRKKKMTFLSKAVFGVFVYWILFVAFTFATFWVKGSIPDTLVQYGLGGGAVELVAAAVVEGLKRKYDKDKVVIEDLTQEDYLDEERRFG